MKQVLAIIATVTIYLGSVLLIDSAIAKDHHAGAEDHSESKHKDADRMREHKGKGKGRDPRRDRSPIRMLFGNLDLSEEQKDQVGTIMREQMEKGKNQREGFKSATRDRLAAVLTEEQLGQLDQNAKRMKDMKSKMDRKKGGPKGKGSKHKKKGKHKPRPQHN